MDRIICIFALVKRLLQQVGAILMALFILGSTTSWTWGEHYCMGHLVDVAIFDQPEGCGMMMDDLDEDEGAEDEKSCCTTEVVFVDGQDQLKLSLDTYDVSSPPAILTAITYWDVRYLPEEEPQIHQFIFPPPELVRDIQLIHEVFLI